MLTCMLWRATCQVGEDFMPGGDWLSNRTMLPATRARLEVLAAGAPRGSMPQVCIERGRCNELR